MKVTAFLKFKSNLKANVVVYLCTLPTIKTLLNSFCAFGALEIFWMNNKTIIEFGFRMIWRIMQISEGVIRLSLRLRRITPSSICIILHIILSLIQ